MNKTLRWLAGLIVLAFFALCLDVLVPRRHGLPGFEAYAQVVVSPAGNYSVQVLGPLAGDSAPLLQASVNALPVPKDVMHPGGGTVSLAPGTYTLGSPITYSTPVNGTLRLVGAGDLATVLLETNPAPVLRVLGISPFTNRFTLGLSDMLLSSTTNACTNLVELQNWAHADISDCVFGWWTGLTNNRDSQGLIGLGLTTIAGTVQTNCNLVGISVNYPNSQGGNDLLSVHECQFEYLQTSIYLNNVDHASIYNDFNSVVGDGTNAWPTNYPQSIGAAVIVTNSAPNNNLNFNNDYYYYCGAGYAVFESNPTHIFTVNDYFEHCLYSYWVLPNAKLNVYNAQQPSGGVGAPLASAQIITQVGGVFTPGGTPSTITDYNLLTSQAYNTANFLEAFGQANQFVTVIGSSSNSANSTYQLAALTFPSTLAALNLLLATNGAFPTAQPLLIYTNALTTNQNWYLVFDPYDVTTLGNGSHPLWFLDSTNDWGVNNSGFTLTTSFYPSGTWSAISGTAPTSSFLGTTNLLAVSTAGVTNNTQQRFLLSLTAGTAMSMSNAVSGGVQIFTPVLTGSYIFQPGWVLHGTAVTGVATQIP